MHMVSLVGWMKVAVCYEVLHVGPQHCSLGFCCIRASPERGQKCRMCSEGCGPVCCGQSLVCASLLVGACRQQVSSLSGYQQRLCSCMHNGRVKNKQGLGNSKLIEKVSCLLRAFCCCCEYLFHQFLSKGSFLQSVCCFLKG